MMIMYAVVELSISHTLRRDKKSFRFLSDSFVIGSVSFKLTSVGIGSIKIHQWNSKVTIRDRWQPRHSMTKTSRSGRAHQSTPSSTQMCPWVKSSCTCSGKTLTPLPRYIQDLHFSGGKTPPPLNIFSECSDWNNAFNWTFFSAFVCELVVSYWVSFAVLSVYSSIDRFESNRCSDLIWYQKWDFLAGCSSAALQRAVVSNAKRSQAKKNAIKC